MEKHSYKRDLSKLLGLFISNFQCNEMRNSEQISTEFIQKFLGNSKMNSKILRKFFQFHKRLNMRNVECIGEFL